MNDSVNNGDQGGAPNSEPAASPSPDSQTPPGDGAPAQVAPVAAKSDIEIGREVMADMHKAGADPLQNRSAYKQEVARRMSAQPGQSAETPAQATYAASLADGAGDDPALSPDAGAMNQAFVNGLVPATGEQVLTQLDLMVNRIRDTDARGIVSDPQVTETLANALYHSQATEFQVKGLLGMLEDSVNNAPAIEPTPEQYAADMQETISTLGQMWELDSHEAIKAEIEKKIDPLLTLIPEDRRDAIQAMIVSSGLALRPQFWTTLRQVSYSAGGPLR